MFQSEKDEFEIKFKEMLNLVLPNDLGKTDKKTYIDEAYITFGQEIKEAVWKSIPPEKSDAVRWLRHETGSGLFECQLALDNLVDVLRKKPYVMDNPYVLEMKWKNKHDSNGSET